MCSQYKLQTYKRKIHGCAAEGQSSDKDDKTSFFVSLLIHLQKASDVALARDNCVLKRVPEHDIGSAILYFQLGQQTAVQQGGAQGREGEDEITAKTLHHATRRQPPHLPNSRH